MNTYRKIKIFLSLLILILLAGCDSMWDNHYQKEVDTVNSTVWNAISNDNTLNSIVNMFSELGLDTLLQQDRVFTLFIPQDDSFIDAIALFSQEKKKETMQYLISNGIILPSQFDELRKIGTLNNKFLNATKNSNNEVFIEGVKVNEISSLYQNGIIYYLESYPTTSENYDFLVKPNIEQFLADNCPWLLNYINSNNERFVDWDASENIGTNEQGLPVYDTIWIENNSFYDRFYPIGGEDREAGVTFTVFDQDLFEETLERDVESVLRIEEVPQVWLNEILFPILIESMVYEGQMAYEDFTHEMRNVRGDKVNTNYTWLNETPIECSNGLVYLFDTYSIAQSIVVDTILVEGEHFVINGEDSWVDDTSIVISSIPNKRPQRLPDGNISGGEYLKVTLKSDGSENGYYLEFKMKNAFPMEYKLECTSNYYSGKIKISVNGVDVGDFDGANYYTPWFKESFPVKHLTEFGDVTVRMTFVDGGAFNSYELYLDNIQLVPVLANK
ncbi:MAG: fasciclin domain-containing protein [Bacteroidales bacterium]|nr:fasciclin domain-containing protein [Bacteroidales bacterium]